MHGAADVHYLDQPASDAPRRQLAKRGLTAVSFEKPFKQGFSAGDEWEAFRPIRPGDVLTVTTVLCDLFEKQGRPGVGRMFFIRYDNTFRNQRNEVVAILRFTSVNFEGPTD